jgi:hypothetical protein
MLLEIGFGCLEQSVELVMTGQLNDFNHLCGIFDPVQHIKVIKVAEIYNFLEALVHDLTLEVDDHLLVLLGSRWLDSNLRAYAFREQF